MEENRNISKIRTIKKSYKKNILENFYFKGNEHVRKIYYKIENSVKIF